MSSWTLLTTRLPCELLITTTRWAGQQLAHSVKLHTVTTRWQIRSNYARQELTALTMDLYIGPRPWHEVNDSGIIPRDG